MARAGSPGPVLAGGGRPVAEEGGSPSCCPVEGAGWPEDATPNLETWSDISKSANSKLQLLPYALHNYLPPSHTIPTLLLLHLATPRVIQYIVSIMTQ